MPGSAVHRLDHLVLTVRNVDATCAFYADVLGMRVATFGEGRIALEFGYQKINVHPAGGSGRLVATQPTPGSGDLCFLTDTPIGRWVTHLNGRGVTIIDGPSRRAGAEGPIESVYFRDPDGNLVEVSNAVERGDPIAPLRQWLTELQACVRGLDYERGRALCAPELVAFGTVAELLRGVDDALTRQWHLVWPRIREFTIRVDEAMGAIDGRLGWVAAPWDSTGVRPDGTTFPRPGRATVTFVHRDEHWLATHSHFSLSPSR